MNGSSRPCSLRSTTNTLVSALDPRGAGLPLAGQIVKHVLVGRLNRIELRFGPLGLVASSGW